MYYIEDCLGPSGDFSTIFGLQELMFLSEKKHKQL